MKTTAWDPSMTLGIGLFDEAHAAMANQIDDILQGPDEAFARQLDALVESLEDDFRLEESLMECIDYPATRSHREEHARVLATLHRLSPQDPAQGRRVVALILPWFQMHLATADTALVTALQLAGQAGVPERPAPAA